MTSHSSASSLRIQHQCGEYIFVLQPSSPNHLRYIGFFVAQDKLDVAAKFDMSKIVQAIMGV
jgi:hypothetical protein